jgi:hypothetical protein
MPMPVSILYPLDLARIFLTLPHIFPTAIPNSTQSSVFTQPVPTRQMPVGRHSRSLSIPAMEPPALCGELETRTMNWRQSVYDSRVRRMRGPRAENLQEEAETRSVPPLRLVLVNFLTAAPRVHLLYNKPRLKLRALAWPRAQTAHGLARIILGP